ncbi:hypothetical protein L1987_54414 [Smallanthus sonchifolius]|uniref:Uncharacterized protein n=1 Tax=Smallanthus sonchifolius TaxID=185202 RepID=A0ACB9E754_9ASTR|nr:hypothetical protein L1987_54414 [Smallanthus sonchifolius]
MAALQWPMAVLGTDPMRGIRVPMNPHTSGETQAAPWPSNGGATPDFPARESSGGSAAFQAATTGGVSGSPWGSATLVTPGKSICLVMANTGRGFAYVRIGVVHKFYSAYVYHRTRAGGIPSTVTYLRNTVFTATLSGNTFGTVGIG